MSHFSTIKTKITDERYLIRAIRELGYTAQQGSLSARGYMGSCTKVNVLIPAKSSGYDVGFRKEGEHYACVADWFGVQDIKQQEFLQKLNQHYATLIVKDQLAEQGFTLAEEQKVDGRIHLVLRRDG
jgi:hypothetical protein